MLISETKNVEVQEPEDSEADHQQHQRDDNALSSAPVIVTIVNGAPTFLETAIVDDEEQGNEKRKKTSEDNNNNADENLVKSSQARDKVTLFFFALLVGIVYAEYQGYVYLIRTPFVHNLFLFMFRLTLAATFAVACYGLFYLMKQTFCSGGCCLCWTRKLKRMEREYYSQDVMQDEEQANNAKLAKQRAKLHAFEEAVRAQGGLKRSKRNRDILAATAALVIWILLLSVSI